MFDNLRYHLKKHVPVTDNDLDLFTRNVKVVNLDKKEYWDLEGQVSTHFSFVNSGLLRHFYNDNGVEKTEKFYFEGPWAGDYSSYLTDSKSARNFQALEETELFVFSFSELQLFYKKSAIIEKFGRLYAEQLIIEAHERNTSFLIDSAEQRYIKLIEKHPNLFSRIPHYYIAQYIGIRPESLSRIRKNILQSKSS